MGFLFVVGYDETRFMGKLYKLTRILRIAIIGILSIEGSSFTWI
jgi:hypothetical protein